MIDTHEALRDFRPTRSFFVGIDSDGCAFDTMELKHKECFIPNTVIHYGLQSVSKYARETWEFVNLYSDQRGVNRFPALARTLELIEERPEVRRRGASIPKTDSLRAFIDSGKPLGNPALEAEVARTRDPGLELALRWSQAVNRDIAEMVHGVSPFPFVRECLEELSGEADMMCVSATPVGALEAEWKEHGLARYVALIVGQEIASKKDALRAAVSSGYAPGKALMIGDAPGDMKAAHASGALFFPIVPGDEEASWERLHGEGLERFRRGTFAGAYEIELIERFLEKLPSVPPWKAAERSRREHANAKTHEGVPMSPPEQPSSGTAATTQSAKGEALGDIGLVGLAVMGQNLVLNMEDHGYRVAVFNRTVSKVDEFLAENPGKKLVGAKSLEDLVRKLAPPRKVMLMVKAGPAVDESIQGLLPHLSKGDIIIDGGNSHFPDTIRRTRDLDAKGFLFIGTGVSGGEEGARHGPSIMPGGSPRAWPFVKEIFQSIAAKVGPENTPCCDWVGPDGAGHYVKMVHNGIEYGDMQLISEAYFLMKESLGMSASDMHEVFAEWNRGELDSYLIEITSDILTKKDPDTGKPLVDVILDKAGQKGTGKWTSVSALDLGVPAPTIVEAVLCRAISAIKEERMAASKVLRGPDSRSKEDRKKLLGAIHDALYCSKICSYAQGFALMAAAGQEYKWDLDFGSIALMWRGGCIIRARFLDRIKDAYRENPKLQNLLLAPFFKDAIDSNQSSWRLVVAQAAQLGIPAPAFSSALGYYDSYRRDRLPANMIQAQRDYFGAHTYERIDKAGVFHTEWTK